MWRRMANLHIQSLDNANARNRAALRAVLLLLLLLLLLLMLLVPLDHTQFIRQSIRFSTLGFKQRL